MTINPNINGIYKTQMKWHEPKETTTITQDMHMDSLLNLNQCSRQL